MSETTSSCSSNKCAGHQHPLPILTPLPAAQAKESEHTQQGTGGACEGECQGKEGGGSGGQQGDGGGLYGGKGHDEGRERAGGTGSKAAALECEGSRQESGNVQGGQLRAHDHQIIVLGGCVVCMLCVCV